MKKKNVSNVLKETHPLTQAQFHLPFQFQLPNSRDSESKKLFLQKEGKKNVSNVLKETHTPARTKNLHTSISISKRSGVQEPFLQKREEKEH